MPESQNIEYKQNWRDDYLKWICGFANTGGGTLFIGLDDEGRIVGLEDYRDLLEQLPNKFRDMLGVYAAVNLQEQSGKYYLEIVVPYYEVPISYKGKYYIRSGSTLQELKGMTLNDFLLKRAGKSWDGVSDDAFSVADLDMETIDRFKAMAADRLPAMISEKDMPVILDKLNLSTNGRLRRAALLLFGKAPQRFFLQARAGLR